MIDSIYLALIMGLNLIPTDSVTHWTVKDITTDTKVIRWERCTDDVGLDSGVLYIPNSIWYKYSKKEM